MFKEQSDIRATTSFLLIFSILLTVVKIQQKNKILKGVIVVAKYEVVIICYFALCHWQYTKESVKQLTSPSKFFVLTNYTPNFWKYGNIEIKIWTKVQNQKMKGII